VEMVKKQDLAAENEAQSEEENTRPVHKTIKMASIFIINRYQNN
jgi:hypothetical protein